MSVWKLAQSNLAGRRARFLIGVCGQCSTNSKDLLGPNNLVPRGQYNGYVKAEAGSIQHRKQEGLQPSLVALFNAASSSAQKVLLLCIDFSTMEVHALAINQWG